MGSENRPCTGGLKEFFESDYFLLWPLYTIFREWKKMWKEGNIFPFSKIEQKHKEKVIKKLIKSSCVYLYIYFRIVFIPIKLFSERWI